MNHTCILPGDVADPSILRVGTLYYLTCSSFCYSPGLLIYRSTDRMRWDVVRSAVPQSFGDIWAPDLVRHQDRYYIYFPSKGTNWVVWSDDPESDWSDPIDLGIRDRIDPGHIVDAVTGTRHLFFNDGYAVTLSDDGLAVTGDPVKVHGAWPFPDEWDTEGICLESPKLFYRAPYYYLTVAQGGTAGPATSHMAVSMRSRELLSGWEMSPYNPVLHTWDVSEEWWSVGHATLFDDEEGNPWLVYHGYRNGNRNMGRQVLLCRAEWTDDGWYRACDGENPVTPGSSSFFSDFVDDFSRPALDPAWSFYRTDLRPRLRAGGGIWLEGRGNRLADGFRMLLNNRWEDCEIGAVLCVPDGAEGGLTFFYNEAAHIGICINDDGICAVIRGFYMKIGERNDAEEIRLRLRKRDNVVAFYFSADGVDFAKAKTSFDVAGYEHNLFGGFLALRPGLYAAGDGAVLCREAYYRKLPSGKGTHGRD